MYLNPRQAFLVDRNMDEQWPAANLVVFKVIL